MVYDFHTHTVLSDGDLTPIELIRRAIVKGYRAIGIADHVGAAQMDRVISEVTRDCDLANQFWEIIALPSIELTHVPVKSLCTLAKQAREAGAKVIVVHGESPVEPVEPGTNLAAVSCPHVNVLAHPGHLTSREAKLAARNGVFIEVSARQGHCLGNGQVAQAALHAGAKLLINSDTHDPGDLLTSEFAHRVAVGAGLTSAQAKQALFTNPEILIARTLARVSQ